MVRDRTGEILLLVIAISAGLMVKSLIWCIGLAVGFGMFALLYLERLNSIERLLTTMMEKIREQAKKSN